MGNKACILDITQSLMPSTEELIWFVKPYFNGIFVQDCDILDSGERKLYGDEISLSVWYVLKLKYGTPDGQHVWTLIDGYKYIYHASKYEFNIYDENGTVVYNVPNVKSIADMHIDFKVHKSHQFIIIIDTKMLRGTFLVPARLVRKAYGESPIMDIFVASNRDKYRRNNRHNYHETRKMIPYTPTRFKKYQVRKELVISEIYNVGQVWRLPRSENYSPEINKLYGHHIKARDAKHNKPIFKGKALQFHILLPLLSITLFPWLCPILRQDEFLNNRPVYEPWLIWGVYKFLTLKRDEEENEIIPDTLELSPNFSY